MAIFFIHFLYTILYIIENRKHYFLASRRKFFLDLSACAKKIHLLLTHVLCFLRKEIYIATRNFFIIRQLVFLLQATNPVITTTIFSCYKKLIFFINILPIYFLKFFIESYINFNINFEHIRILIVKYIYFYFIFFIYLFTELYLKSKSSSLTILGLIG